MARIENCHEYSPHWGEAGFKSQLAKASDTSFVARIDGKTAGFLCATIVSPEMQLDNIAVDPRRMGKGLGKALLARLRDEARAKKCHIITLEVDEANSGAIAFYESFGMSCSGRRPKYYAGSRDAVLMVLNI